MAFYNLLTLCVISFYSLLLLGAILSYGTEEECAAGKIDQRFVRVLDDNITACVNANYDNKVKVLRYMREIVVKVLSSHSRSLKTT